MKITLKTILFYILILIAFNLLLFTIASLNSKADTIDKVPEVQKPVTPEEAMLKIAQTKMDDLLNTNYWSHTNSDGCDFNCRTKDIPISGIHYSGENLYKSTCNDEQVKAGHCSLEEAYRLWHNSPTHEKVLQHSYTRLLILQEHKGDQYYIVYFITE